MTLSRSKSGLERHNGEFDRYAFFFRRRMERFTHKFNANQLKQ